MFRFKVQLFACLTLCLANLTEAKEACAEDVLTEAVAGSVAELLVEKHWRQRSNGALPAEELSDRWAKQYLLTLDPYRMHFLRGDVAALTRQSASLIKEAKQGNSNFALEAARVFRKRLTENTKEIAESLQAKHDFSTDESVSIKHLTFAVSSETVRERWRKRIKHELLIENSYRIDEEQTREFLSARYRKISEHYGALEDPDFLAIYLDALAKSLDPNSAYMDEKFLSMYRVSILPEYEIGLRTRYRDGDLRIMPSPHLPEAHSIIGKRIVAVSRAGGDPVHLVGLSFGDAIRTMISPVGELGNAAEILVDIDDPRTGMRSAVKCERARRGSK